MASNPSPYPPGLSLAGGTITGNVQINGSLGVAGAISQTTLNSINAAAGVNCGIGSLDVQQAGQGLKVREGSNAKQGTATLVAGTVTVANTSVTASSIIVLGHVSPAGAPGALFASSITAGTGFTITSTSATDTSVVGYEIFEPG